MLTHGAKRARNIENASDIRECIDVSAGTEVNLITGIKTGKDDPLHATLRVGTALKRRDSDIGGITVHTGELGHVLMKHTASIEHLGHHSKCR